MTMDLKVYSEVATFLHTIMHAIANLYEFTDSCDREFILWLCTMLPIASFMCMVEEVIRLVTTVVAGEDKFRLSMASTCT